ncbi:D-isomer specific 2-hydroxyacid dehydrogenase, NAD-binding [Rhodopseudomonas palustris HaA2]|uniref:D-isomer specific 2-hydroxyacid dehydrogenase, NAD-binding n=1 Tax=Rhodopseudomonas palustris (strain HaA2) TaxID=316058 RepID=Q2IXU8_RHOP2|nr:2-hydroxyacid dehydrogenase [Rhodopseudomonas palustris]ABD06962.1 D-isomer specific 2-hydroxyacid dehydrogenase, NAD-binding [Rhodopseudomonas palustris HaA2]
MKVAVFNTKPYDRQFLTAANTKDGDRHELRFLEPRLGLDTAQLSGNADAICAFVNDGLDRSILERLKDNGVRLVALRCAGFNNVDLLAARDLEITVARVPAYSPSAVAEHTVALILSLNRRIHRAHARVREGNFALDGLLGFDLRGRSIGIVGTGNIGLCLAGIMTGFGCRVLGFDPRPNPAFEALGGRLVGLEELLSESDIVSLHCPLTPDTRHMIDETSIAKMKPGVMLINTGRGALIDTRAVIQGLKNKKIGFLGLDVYEEESDLFFENLSGQIIQDDDFARLLTFPNVLITGHQAFFTQEALMEIADTTIRNISQFELTGQAAHPISLELRV